MAFMTHALLSILPLNTDKILTFFLSAKWDPIWNFRPDNVHLCRKYCKVVPANNQLYNLCKYNQDRLINHIKQLHSLTNNIRGIQFLPNKPDRTERRKLKHNKISKLGYILKAKTEVCNQSCYEKVEQCYTEQH